MPGDITLGPVGSLQGYALLDYVDVVEGRKLAYKVQRYTVKQFLPAVTLGVQETQEAINPYSSIVYYPPIYGLGVNRIGRRIGGKIDQRDFLRLWNAEGVMTWWPTYTALALLPENSTKGLDQELFRAWTVFKGNLFVASEQLKDTSATSSATAYSYTGSTTTWTVRGQIHVSTGAGDHSVATDMIAHKDRVVCLWLNSNDHLTSFHTNPIAGSNFTPATTPIAVNLMSDAVARRERIDGGLLASLGNEIIAAVWHEANGTITFYSSTDGSVNWTDETIDIASSGGPKGLVVYPGVDNADKLLLGTHEGLYEIDTSPATWTFKLIYPLIGDADNCRRMTVHDGSLWFAQGVDDNTPAKVIRYTSGPNLRDFEVNVSRGVNGMEEGVYLGPGAGDTCDSALLGPVKWWHSAGGLLFASVGGSAASRDAWIMLHNGKGWHNFHQHGTANVPIETFFVASEDDGVIRLHEALGSGNTHTAQFLAHPLSNPQDGQTYKYVASGIMHRPEFNLGMPRFSKAILKIFADAISLGTTSTEYEKIAYGLNGAAANDVALGNVVNGTLALDIASGAGVSGRSIAVSQELFRTAATNTLTPKDRGVEVDLSAKIPTVEGYRVKVDINETAEKNGLALVTVVQNIETAARETALLSLTYANRAVAYVRITEPLVWLDAYDAPIAPDTAAQVGGRVHITMEQVIRPE